MPSNPFAPTFGVAPPVLAGRDDILAEIARAMNSGPRHPSYTSFLLGRRGSGKTVLLKALRDWAHGRRWLTVAVAAAGSGVPNRIAHEAVKHLNRHLEDLPDLSIMDLRVAGIGIGDGYVPDVDMSRALSDVLGVLSSWLGAAGGGLLLTVDELHAGNTDELRALGVALQDVSRLGQNPMMFVGAGLPVLEDTLLADTSVTFLQRCARFEIGHLDPAATWLAVAEPVEQSGGRISSAAVERAVEASGGYPFLVQLIGFHMWQASDDPEAAITLEDVAAGCETAANQLGRLVIGPLWRDCSDVAKRFLAAMALDDRESPIAGIAARMGVSSGYANSYRHRLIRAGMIVPAGHGRVSFAHEAARRWIRDLPEYPSMRESLKPDTQSPVGFARPGGRGPGPTVASRD